VLLCCFVPLCIKQLYRFFGKNKATLSGDLAYTQLLSRHSQIADSSWPCGLSCSGAGAVLPGEPVQSAKQCR